MLTLLMLVSLASGFVGLFLVYRKAKVLGVNGIAEALGAKSLSILTMRNINSIFLLLPATLLFLLWGSEPEIFEWPGRSSLQPWFMYLVFTCIVISLMNGICTKNIKECNEGWVMYLSTRIISLTIYEIYFRGVVQSILLFYFPFAFALAISVFMYVMVHAFSPRTELFGSIPFGLVLFWIVFYSGSVLPTIILHLSIALPFEINLLFRSRSVKKMSMV